MNISCFFNVEAHWAHCTLHERADTASEYHHIPSILCWGKKSKYLHQMPGIIFHPWAAQYSQWCWDILCPQDPLPALSCVCVHGWWWRWKDGCWHVCSFSSLPLIKVNILLYIQSKGCGGICTTWPKYCSMPYQSRKEKGESMFRQYCWELQNKMWLVVVKTLAVPAWKNFKVLHWYSQH